MRQRNAADADTRPITRVEFLVVDVETTGLSTTDDVILQVGAVVTDASGRIKRSFSTYVRPGNGSLPWNTPQPPAHEIHGISNDDVNRGLPTRRALRRLRRLARRRILVAHNAKFDYGFISSESLRHAVPLRVDNPVCTLELSRKLDPKRAESHRLATLCERYGIPLDNAHDALCDATATARLLSILIKNHGATTVDDLRKISARKAA
ncbi:MAG: 3'-5' exonuclease [Ilumatobacteraceae bacterium]|nr:3'-5' exonuclease [Ilumatobacteraceae bacterium]